jgi:hypothetical protein
MYGDAAHELRNLRHGPVVACGVQGGEDREGRRVILAVPVPATSAAEHDWLSRVTLHDDFFSSVPKFVLALVDLYARHPEAKWYYVAGCDTYLIAANMLRALGGLDHRRRILLGGHPGIHFAKTEQLVFLSGGSGLIFSRAYVEALAPRAPQLLRAWLEVDGARYRCTPCADIFFVHTSRILGAQVIERPSFFAYWPHYYVSSTADPATDSTTVRWPPVTEDDEGEEGLGEECDGIKVLKGGLGVSASGWWGRLNPITPRPIAFHYLQPRSMRLLHAYFTTRNSSI